MSEFQAFTNRSQRNVVTKMNETVADLQKKNQDLEAKIMQMVQMINRHGEVLGGLVKDDKTGSLQDRITKLENEVIKRFPNIVKDTPPSVEEVPPTPMAPPPAKGKKGKKEPPVF